MPETAVPTILDMAADAGYAGDERPDDVIGALMLLASAIKGAANPEDVAAAIEDWVEAHPEAVAAIADGAITTDKLADAAVTSEKLDDDVLAMFEEANSADIVAGWLRGNQLTGELSGTIATASDAYAAPPMALSVEGVSTQDGTPTPDAPVAIKSVDDLSLVMAGKNLFDTTKLTTTGVTLDGNEIAVSGTHRDLFTGTTGNTAAVADRSSVLLLPSGTFRLRCAKTDMTIILKKVNADGTVTELARSGYSTTTWGVTFTLDSPTFVTLRATGGTITDLQIEIGSTATAYEPYIGTTVPDLLPEGTDLRSLPDGTCDTLSLAYLRPSTREGWAWYERELVQAVGHKVVTAFDRIGAAVSGGFHSRRGIVDIDEAAVNDTNAGICSHAPWSKSSSAYTGYLSIITAFVAYTNNKVLSVSLTLDENDENFTTLENMNAWVAENGPIVFDYKLVTPVTTQLDPIELPTLPAPTATVWCDGGSAQPTYTMEYVKDTNAVIQRLEDIISDLATS